MPSVIRGNDNFDSQPPTGGASTNGYIRFPSWIPVIGGLTIQWGLATVLTGNTSVTETLPTPFLTAHYAGVCVRTSANEPDVNDIYAYQAQTLSTARIWRTATAPSGRSVFYIAIGK